MVWPSFWAMWIQQTDHQSVCDIFKHTEQHEARPADVIRFLKENNIEFNRDFKLSHGRWKVPYICKTHQVLHIGMTDSETHITDYNTIVYEHTSGKLTVDIIRLWENKAWRCKQAIFQDPEWEVLRCCHRWFDQDSVCGWTDEASICYLSVWRQW